MREIEKTEAYRRALAAEPRLEALEAAVYALAGKCHGCAWEQVIKPLALPLVGFERGYLPESAEDPCTSEEDWTFGGGLTGAEIAALPPAPRVHAETETEAWMRTMEAFDEVTDPWLFYLRDAEQEDGLCGLGFPA